LVVHGILGAPVGAGVAATKSVASQGAMYTVGDTCWSTPPPVWFGPAVHLPTLRRLRVGDASTCANLELESALWSFFGCDAV
jgi:hypothetical protein